MVYRGAAVAFDPDRQEFVLWGASASGQASNSTWTLSEVTSTWANVTGSLTPAPPALEYAGLTWDSAWGGLLLTGGIYASGAPSNETWLFDGQWTNETLSVGPTPPIIGAAWAYDGAFSPGLLVGVDGCPALPTSEDVAQTYALASPGSSWVNDSAVLGVPGPECTNGSTMDYDPVDQQLVFFGGEEWGGSSYAPRNSTWVLNGTTSRWSNITATANQNSPAAPSGALFGSMTWDGQIGATVLFGGNLLVPGGPGPTWVLQDDVWWAINSLLGSSVVGPHVEDFGVMSSDSSEVAPMLFGGYYGSYLGSLNTTWVLEVPPKLIIYSVSPDPIDTGQTVTMTGGLALGSGSGYAVGYSASDGYAMYLTTGSGGGSYSFGVNNTFHMRFQYVTGPPFAPVNYPTGSYTLTFTATDFFGLVSTVVVHQTVNSPLSTTIATSPPLTELGALPATISYRATPSGGTPNYTTVWHFGDGTTSDQVAGNHTYTTAGTFQGWVTVTDEGGGATNNSFEVVVDPALEATIGSNVTSTDLGLPVAFTSTVGGGNGSYALNWSFGDGTTATAASPSHAYDRAGQYVVELNVTDSAGYRVEVTRAVVVNPPLAGSASASSGTSSTGSSVAFGAIPVNGTAPYSYSWDFGDGSPNGTGPVVAHAFALAGTYEVTCTIEDAVHEKVVREIEVSVRSSSAASPVAGLGSGAVPYVIGSLAVLAIVLGTLWLVTARRLRRKGSGGEDLRPPAENG